MSEQYIEYRSRRKSRGSHSRGKSGYGKRLARQIVFSLLCLSSVYLLKQTDTELAETVSSHIKSALNYKINTKKITVMLDGLLFQPDTADTDTKSQEPGNGEEMNVQNTEETMVQDI